MLLRSIEERFTSVDDKFERQFEKKKILEHTINFVLAYRA